MCQPPVLQDLALHPVGALAGQISGAGQLRALRDHQRSLGLCSLVQEPLADKRRAACSSARSVVLRCQHHAPTSSRLEAAGVDVRLGLPGHPPVAGLQL